MKNILLITSVFIFLLGAIYASLFLIPPPPEKKDERVDPLTREQLWNVVQNWRIKNNLKVYKFDKQLCDFSDMRISQIQKDFSHNGFWSDTNKLFNQGYKRVAENLIRGYSPEKSALESWINSPEHLKNLKDSYTNSCISTHNTFAVQVFASY